MGFYLRKNVRLGPLRFNLSKSGIGVSTGVPGFRVGIGPRGTYVHMGRGGFYYRQTISSRPRESGRRQQSFEPDYQLTESRPITHGPMDAIESDDINQMVDSSSIALLTEIRAKQKRIRLWPITLTLSSVGFLILFAMGIPSWAMVVFLIMAVVSVFLAIQYDLLKKSVVMMYDLDDSALKAYQRLFSAFTSINNCGAAWHVTAKGDVYDPKYHAGAGQLNARKHLSSGIQGPPYIKTNLSVPYIAFRHLKIYVLPDWILVYSPGGEVGAVDYSHLMLTTSTIRFIEDGHVPRDAMVVDHTWTYVNKDGSPDRRFKNNRQLPICNYEEINISSTNGIREVLQVSRLGIGKTLTSAIRDMVHELEQARIAEEHRKQQGKQRRLSDHAEETPSKTTDQQPQVSKPDVYKLLVEVLCCVMVADGRASRSEKEIIENITSQIDSAWSKAECSEIIEEFVQSVKRDGIRSVVVQVLNKLPIFQRIGREEYVVKFVESVARADGKITDRELELCNEIRKRLGYESVSEIALT